MMSRDTWGGRASRSTGMRIGRRRPQRGGQCCGCGMRCHVRGEASVLGGEGKRESLSGRRGTTSDTGRCQGGRWGKNELFRFRVEILGSERFSN